MCVLSICITTFNQSDLLRNNLNQIIQYKGDEIEIVVSDNCSTEDIKTLVESYNDGRIKYYRTNSNVGQDGNVLFGLSKCSGEYSYLFRTRDSIISDNIPQIIDYIRHFPNASFFLFSALDEDSKEKMILKDRIYKKGNEAIGLLEKIISHPSGMLYKTSDLELNTIGKYINSFFETRYSFISHDMIQMALSMKGNFVTSHIFGWIYTNTNNVKSVSSNDEGYKENIYAPLYQNQRFRCLYWFAYNELSAPYNLLCCKQLIRRYIKYEVIAYPLWLRDKGFKQHYKIDNVKSNRIKTYCDLKKLILLETEKMNLSDQKVLRKALITTSLKIPYWIIRSIAGYILRTLKVIK